MTKTLNDIKKEIGINDLNLEKAKIIFILESPEKKEIELKIPAVGQTGENLYKHILSNKNIGCYIKCNTYKPDNFGIMETSLIPLGSSETPYNSSDEIFKEINYLKKLNEKYQKPDDLENFVNCIKNSEKINEILNISINKETINELVNDFNFRFENLTLNRNNERIMFIVCGMIAQAFFCNVVGNKITDNLAVLWKKTNEAPIDLLNNKKFIFMDHPTRWEPNQFSKDKQFLRKCQLNRIKKMNENIIKFLAEDYNIS